MKKNILILVFLAAISSYLPASAAGGKLFGDFAVQLEPYFTRPMIEDIKKQLPLTENYKIWGWDVGDFSGDGYPDCAITVNLHSEKKRRMHVYLFADIDGYLKKIGHYPYYYVDLPLEIGVSIAGNACSITKKNEKYSWDIYSYTYQTGVVVLKSHFSTRRIGDLTYEKTVDYLSLTNTEKFIYTKSKEIAFYREFSSIVSYPRGKQVFKGYTRESLINNIDYVYSGAWYLDGRDDLSYTVKSAYDSDFLYFTVNVTDDKIVVRSCDDCIVTGIGEQLSKTCDTCFADHINMWIDVYTPFEENENRFMTIENNRINFRNSAERTIMKFSIYPGDFHSQDAEIEIATNDYLNSFRRFDTRKLKASANLTDKGYIVKFRIPLRVLGYENCPTDDKKIVELGTSFAVVDYDNKFRPHEKTEMANSDLKPYNPTTYGSLFMIPYNQYYGEAENIFEMDILQALREYGF